MCLYDPEMIIFIEENGSDKRDSLRKYAYSLRGRSHKIISRGEHVSAIDVACLMLHGSVHSEVYREFVEKFLVPHLLPYNGYNPQCCCP